MTSTSETGHPVNVASFQLMISYVIGYGAVYNPSLYRIKLSELNSLLAVAKSAQYTSNKAFTVYHDAVDDRVIAMEPFSRHVTRIFHAFQACGTNKEKIRTAQTIVRKLHGQRATPKKTEEEKARAIAKGKIIVEKSSSQKGFTNQADFFEQLIQVLESEPLYCPNEVEFQIASLKNELTTMRVKNQAVAKAEVKANSAGTALYQVLYADGTGVCDIAKLVKSYVRSVFGSRSPEYKKISKIPFRKFKK